DPLPDLDAIVAKAIDGRYDVARARNEVANAATSVEYFGNQKLPDVRLETSYRGSGLGGSQLLRTGVFPGVITGRADSGFGDVLGQVFGRDYPTWSFGLTVSYPLGHSYEELSAVRAGVERRQAAARVASLQLDVAAALQLAPPLTAGGSIALQGSNVVPLPTPAPRGVFRPGAGTGF